jgi:hypothetical protein
MRSLNQVLRSAPLLLAISGLATIVISVALAGLPEPYSSPAANIALQLPQTATQLGKQLHDWSVDPQALERYLRMDTVFPMAYALFLALLCGLLGQLHTEAGRRSLGPTGKVLSWVVLLCMPLDWLENHWLARAFDQAPGAADWYLQLGHQLSATPKYLLLALALAWIMFALIGLLAGRRASQVT